MARLASLGTLRRQNSKTIKAYLLEEGFHEKRSAKCVGAFRAKRVSCCSCGIVSSCTHACEQEFTFECKTRGNYSVLEITERRFGECQRTNRIALYLSPDEVPAVQFSDRGFTALMVGHREKETFLEIADSAGIFLLPDSATLSPPAFDSVFADSIKARRLKGTTIMDFYRDCFDNCIDEPRFDNCRARLVWLYGWGLYKNYSIDRVLYFPESRYLLVFTLQPIQFSYKITWHGVLLYKLAD